MPLEDARVPGSCVWLTAKPLYQTWQAAQPGSRSIFWLIGNAGSGKSTLCAHVIDDLKKRNLSCSYFFFKHGDATKSIVAKCLLALVYQMAMSDMHLLQRLLAMQQNGPHIEQWDERTIWRNLFAGCIFKSQNIAPRYLVIDAVDECLRFPVLLSLFSQAPPHLRIFFVAVIHRKLRKIWLR